VGLTEEQVAQRAASTSQRVRELVEVGILEPRTDDDGPFRDGDVLRIRLVDELEASGVPPTRVAAAIARGSLSLSYLDRLPAPAPRAAKTYAQLCDDLGIRFDLLDRIYTGFGLACPDPEERVRHEDLGVISDLPVLFEAGLGETEVLRAARVWGEGPRRVAEHQVHSFHELIEEPFRRQGLSDDQALDAALTRIGIRLIPFCERLVMWLYRRHFETYATEHRVGHVERALDSAGIHRKPTPHAEACAFADLSGYTTLTEELGDAAASEMALRLAELVQDVANRHAGRVVKMLGDGVHFIYQDSSNAVLGSLELVERAEQEGLPPAHVGVNAGPMTYTDGDYYGLAVIIAARIAAHAAPGQVLVGEAVLADERPEGVRLEEIGPISLKGIAHPVVTYRAVRDGSAPAPAPDAVRDAGAGAEAAV
jgi:adenylate cyclase